ncbi:hypothetical protein WJM97_12860 [Okeanomitos corallinicola TIOX110]|uniref:Uncharacterized protein n=1 Tax=Okeanomitos corallinicola TIOX110 TaxID=3133117 RepID=A0ABZ2UM17_9CYAN
MDSLINEFCQTVRERSIEHQKAVSILLENGIIGVAITVLRQEIDSLIRVSYLCSLQDSVKLTRILRDFRSGKKWPVTDRVMVDQEVGWVKLVYDLSCNLIHLTSFHNYNRNDPFLSLDTKTKTEIVNSLKKVHQYPYETISKEQFTPYISKVLEKIVSNTECYLKKIEKNASK